MIAYKNDLRRIYRGGEPTEFRRTVDQVHERKSLATFKYNQLAEDELRANLRRTKIGQPIDNNWPAEAIFDGLAVYQEVKQEQEADGQDLVDHLMNTVLQNMSTQPSVRKPSTATKDFYKQQADNAKLGGNLAHLVQSPTLQQQLEDAANAESGEDEQSASDDEPTNDYE